MNSDWHSLLNHSNGETMNIAMSQYSRFLSWAWPLPEKEKKKKLRISVNLTQRQVMRQNCLGFIWSLLAPPKHSLSVKFVALVLLWCGLVYDVVVCLFVFFPCSTVVNLPTHSGTLRNRTCSRTCSCWWPAGPSFVTSSTWSQPQLGWVGPPHSRPVDYMSNHSPYPTPNLSFSIVTVCTPW